MNVKRTLVVLTVATVAFAGGAVLSKPHWAPSWQAFASSGQGDQDGMGHRHGMHDGMHGRHGHHGFGRLCGPGRQARLDVMVGFMESFADFTPEQETAWTAFTASLEEGGKKLDATCEALKDADRPATAPERLARMELMMSTGLAALQDVRPAFEAFYASLDENQQKALDRMTRRGGHWR